MVALLLALILLTMIARAHRILDVMGVIIMLFIALLIAIGLAVFAPDIYTLGFAALIIKLAYDSARWIITGEPPKE